MTSSTKPEEVHNVMYCRQKRTKPRPLLTGTENLMKFGHVIFEICTWTDRDTQTCWLQYYAPLLGAKKQLAI